MMDSNHFDPAEHPPWGHNRGKVSLSRGEWDKLSDDEKWQQHFIGISLSDIFTRDQISQFFAIYQSNIKTLADLDPRLIIVACEAGSAFGISNHDAIAEMCVLIANRSYLRFDKFGMDTDRVKELAVHLVKKGMSKQSAFVKAVGDVGMATVRSLKESVK